MVVEWEQCNYMGLVFLIEMASVGSVDIVNQVEDPDVLLNPTTSEKPNKPFVGMVFSSIEEAKFCYEEHGIATGFSVRRRSSYSTARGPQLTRVLFTCSCEGVHKKKCGLDDERKTRKSVSMKTGCKAMIRIARDRNTGKWFVNKFCDDHNHALVSPTKRLLRSNEYMAVVARDLGETFTKENLQSSMVAVDNDFIVKYEQAVDEIYINERKEDYISLYNKRSVNSEDLLLHHAAKTYTMNIFEKVQFEFNAACRFRAVEVDNDGDDKKFKVQSRASNNEEFVVKINEVTKEGVCGCLLFEFMGIPCRHLFRVFDRLYIDEIPSHFIMKRWTKDVNRTEIIGSYGLLMHNRHLGSEEMQIIHYYRRSTQLAYMIGKSKEAYIVAMGFLDQAFEKVKLLDDIALQSENTDKPSSETCNSVTDTVLLDSHVSQTEGRKRVKKETDKAVDSSTCSWKSEIEKSEGRKKPRICIFCSGYGHDSHNCILKSKNTGININGAGSPFRKFASVQEAPGLVLQFSSQPNTTTGAWSSSIEIFSKEETQPTGLG
ncbi:FAR1 DNA binding domain [Macleaya cordata]|uniref:FAR1 DNA binding domain n=1 Tax=Macleaya cordata TaxID=56857 RepID=A0A200QBX1_MACCD|nr:FAR1 DNA binding domain [Macleaya cordata]